MIVQDDCLSLEIVQAFLLWFPWLPPSNKLSEDRILFYVQRSYVMAKELGLDRPMSVTDEDVVSRPG